MNLLAVNIINSHMKRSPYIIPLLLCCFSILKGQDCQLVSMNLDIPAGVSKHHFPVQEMPANYSDDTFSYLAAWNTGNMTVRIRFSEDGTEWTKWDVLKRDFKKPEALNSPLHVADQQYTYFEWAVYNNSGIENQLSLNFYYPGEDLYYADLAEAYNLEISTVGCPVAPSAEDQSPISVVSTNDQ